MKKLILLFFATLALMTSRAQWVNDPVNNTFLANTSADAGEIYLSTDPNSGDTYVQWTQFFSNGWSPTIQRIAQDGTPQWGADGIHIGGPQFSSYSEGIAMAATSDGGVVSCFATTTDTRAVKINADGTFAWGEEGLQLFGGQGFSRTELLAGYDGGVWALGSDYDNTYLCYIEADGTLNPTITLSDDGGRSISFSQMLPNSDNAVFVIYESNQWAYTYYYEKELWVVSYTKAGTQVTPPTLLMAPQTMGGSYAHYVVPDGQGGGYAFIWHPGTGSFNTYVFHFDVNGLSTIDNPNGAPVHSDDLANFYIDAYATADPTTHDLIIAFQQTDVTYQRECKIFVNRITPTGDRLWGDGYLVLDNGYIPCGGLRVDAFEDGSGFSVIYHKGVAQNSMQSTVEAKGFDMNHNELWTTELCTNAYAKTGDKNSTGFHNGQNILAWINSSTGGLYGQNIQPDGTMGIVVPPQPPVGCLGPENFRGEYVYDDETMTFGALLSWDLPEEPVEVYRLTRKSKSTGEEAVFEFTTERPTYFDFSGIGRFRYQLQALYANLDCGFSQPATTPDGADFVTVEVTSVPENNEEAIVTVLNVYTLSGQRVQSNRLETLSKGVYLLEGLTSDGKRIHRKIAITE